MSTTSPFIGGTGVVQGSPEPVGFYGPYRGIVTNTTDPASQNRLKAVIPQLFGNASTECDWALPMMPGGYSAFPQPGQGVWIQFEGGDINYPVWTGMWQPSGVASPYDLAGAAAAAQATAEAYTVAQIAAIPPITIPVLAGSLAIDYTATGSLSTYLTSASFSVGTWVVNWTALAYNASGVDQAGFQIGLGTAVGTFAGPVTMESRNDSATLPFAAMNHQTTKVTITSPGTLIFQVIGLQANKPLIKASTPSGGTTGSPTGYVAVMSSAVAI